MKLVNMKSLLLAKLNDIKEKNKMIWSKIYLYVKSEGNKSSIYQEKKMLNR